KIDLEMSLAPSIPRLHSPFLCCPSSSPRLLLLYVYPTNLQEINGRPGPIHALELWILIKTRFFPPLFSFRNHVSTTFPILNTFLLNSGRHESQVVAISVGLVSVAVGIGIPVFYETQIDSAAKRDNTQPCFPCSGTGAQKCRFCTGTGTVVVELGGDEKEVSNCINCDGVGSFTCTTCQGSGIQPRYLDRREFKDDD
ncbi:DnaJ/Hsp40 cysteine-rich domain superfamily protein, partial [Prunus dulcis]